MLLLELRLADVDADDVDAMHKSANNISRC